MKKLFFTPIFILVAFIFLIIGFNTSIVSQVDCSIPSISELIGRPPPNVINPHLREVNSDIYTETFNPILKMVNLDKNFKYPDSFLYNPQPTCITNIYPQSCFLNNYLLKLDNCLSHTFRSFNRKTMFAKWNYDDKETGSVMKVTILAAINNGNSLKTQNNIKIT